jgi:hypothetical protein
LRGLRGRLRSGCASFCVSSVLRKPARQVQSFELHLLSRLRRINCTCARR